MENENLCFAACQIGNGLKLMTLIDIGDNKYGRPFKIKRFSGQDIFAVGCAKHIVILKYANNRLLILKSYLDVHADFICDLCVVKNMIFSKGRGESFVRVTYFGDQFDTVAKVKEESENTRPSAQILSQNLVTNQPAASQATISHIDVPMCRFQ